MYFQRNQLYMIKVNQKGDFYQLAKIEQVMNVQIRRLIKEPLERKYTRNIKSKMH